MKHDTTHPEGNGVKRGTPLSSAAIALVVLDALLLTDLGYRAALLWHLLRETVTPFSFVPSAYSVSRVLRASAWDFSVHLPIGAAVLCLVAAGRWALRRRPQPSKAWSWLGLCALGLLLLVVGLVDALNLRLLLAMHAALDVSMLVGAASAFSLDDLFDYGQPVDFVIALAPLVLAAALARMSLRKPRLPLAVGVALGLFFALLLAPAWFVPVPKPYPPKLHASLYDTPLLHLWDDVGHTLSRSAGMYERRADALPVPAELRFDPPQAAWQTAPRQRMNVLLVIMESTGARYVFDQRWGPMPMPRLRSLAKQGLTLERHYATANTSPRAIFSIFTGLYPQPTSTMFCTRPDVRLPGIGTYLGEGYDRFFVTPGRLQSYMPRAMLIRDGMHEMYGYDELPIENPIELPAGGRSEVQTADFFLQRLSRAKEPFFATYYSYAPHFGYYDQGEQYRVRKDLDDEKSRYYNSMRLLDTQIGRFVDQLQKSGQLERTVIVLVGDHGEAFGQHKGNYTHSHKSYDENLRVPAIFYHPKLFAPRAHKGVTSHSDLLPTLLDALGIAYEDRRLQGSSLLRGEPARPFVYAWGSEGVLSSVDRTGKTKLQVSFEDDTCRYFDLEHDASEQDAEDCKKAIPSVQEQLAALLRFYRLQRVALARENARIPE